MRLLMLTALALVFLIPSVRAEQRVLSVDLAEDHVDITTGFNGAVLSLFGVQDQDGDIAITIKGPRRPMIVRRKERVFGLWMNRKAVDFEDVPVYYDYALSKPEAEIASSDVLAEHKIGVETLRYDSDDVDGAQELKLFQDALIRNKQEKRLYPKIPQDITYIDNKFFRTSFYIPSNVPTGLYTIETYLIKEGNVEAMWVTELKVAQVGKSAAVYSFSHSWSFAYGILAVLFAVGAGWFSNSIRNRLR